MPAGGPIFCQNIPPVPIYIYLECRSCFFSCRMQDSLFFLGQALPCLALYRLATQLQIAKGELFGFFTEPILLQWFIICLYGSNSCNISANTLQCEDIYSMDNLSLQVLDMVKGAKKGG